jgi:hypothetical protein
LSGGLVHISGRVFEELGNIVDLLEGCEGFVEYESNIVEEEVDELDEECKVNPETC